MDQVFVLKKSSAFLRRLSGLFFVVDRSIAVPTGPLHKVQIRSKSLGHHESRTAGRLSQIPQSPLGYDFFAVLHRLY